MTGSFPKFGYDPVTGEWNDSLKGDYCWSSVNYREAAPDVMTPSTWSLIWTYINVIDPIRFPGEHPAGGNICGRLYFNVSLISSLYRAIGQDARKAKLGDLMGAMPAGLGIPNLPFSPLAVIWYALPGMIKDRMLIRRDSRQFGDYIAQHPGWCRAMQTRIQQCPDAAGLLTLWNESLLPNKLRDLRMLRSMTINLSAPATRLKLDLTALVGEVEANTLLSNLSGESGELESLGPLVGLAKVKNGTLGREEYAQRYGHRGSHEVELSAPGSDEDPDWLDKRLADFTSSFADLNTRLAKQRAECATAWQRFETRFPGQYESFRRRLAVVAEAAKSREAVRSESIRSSRLVTRPFLLQVGNVLGIGDGVFFLSLDEVIALLSGDQSPLSAIPARRGLYKRYCALPTYPAIIYGRFDPFKWAADPNRRSDFYDARQTTTTTLSATIQGYAGAMGCVEGIVRRIDCVEAGNQIQPGEILVTPLTNIGWTPLFPRLAAVVTDIGAPLSHAAIVARELGIPAVVGCGNATMLLKTGDRVRVDGGSGTVEVIERVG